MSQEISKEFNPKDVELLHPDEKPIKDHTAYLELQKVEQHPLLNHKKKFTASDGKEYNLGRVHTILQKDIAHLPIPEQKKIMKWKDMEYKVKMKRMSLIRQAYGKSENQKDLSHPLDIIKDELIELFGRMFSTGEVHKVILTKFKGKGLSRITVDQVKHFRVKHLLTIQKKIEEFKREYTDMRLAIKRGRLEELVYIYNIRKRIYEGTQKGEDHKILLSTLEQIRKEAEGDTLRIEGEMNINTEVLIQQQVDREIMSSINLKEVVIARIAAKSGIPIKMFLGQLEKSWYNKAFNDAEEAEYEEIPNPSNQSYDFDRIKGIQKQNQEQMKLEASKPDSDLTDVQVIKANRLKEALIRRLQGKKADVLTAKNTLTQAATLVDD